MVLAANTNIDELSSFTACISAIPLRLNVGFIDIYELFSGEIAREKKEKSLRKGGKYRENNEITLAQYAIKRREVFGGFADFPAFF